MRITHINVSNVLRVPHLDADIPDAMVLAAGPNESGKSSLRDAIDFAMTGEPPRGLLKRDLKSAIHRGTKQGSVTIHDGDKRVTRSLNTGKITEGSSDALLAQGDEAFQCLLRSDRFMQLDAKARRTMLYELMKVRTSKDAVAERLRETGLDEPDIETLVTMLHSGFGAAEKWAQDEAAGARAAWKAITGETYGSQKANGWQAQTSEQPEIDIDSLEAQFTKALQASKIADQHERDLRARAAAAQEQAEHREKQAYLANSLPDWEAEHADLLSDLDKAEKEAERAKKLYAGAKACYDGCECPHCGGSLRIKDGKIVEGGEIPSGDELERLKTEALEKHNEARDLRDHLEELQPLIAKGRAAKEWLQQPSAHSPSSDEIEKAGKEAQDARELAATLETKFIDARRQSEAAEAAVEKTRRAAKAHEDVERWTAARDLLSPTGIPTEMLAKAIQPINESLAVLASSAGWKVPTLDAEMQISVAGLPYPLLSESARWRVDALMALTLANASGLGIVFLDRFDVLDLPGRNQALGLMRELAGEFVDQVWLFGTLKSAPKVDGVTTLWLGESETKQEVA